MLHPKSSMDDVFVPVKADQSMILDVLFIQSSVPLLKKFIGFLTLDDKPYARTQLSLPFFIDIEELLRKLIIFVLDLDHSNNPDVFKCTGVHPPTIRTVQRQNLMRECRFIDLLIDCLRYPFNN
jgi:hypothetical protein